MTTTSTKRKREVRVRIGDWTSPSSGEVSRLVVHAELGPSRPEGRTHQTVDHGEVTDPWRLSLTGDIRCRRAGSSHWGDGGSGQIADYLPLVTAFAQADENGAGLGWDANRVLGLRRLWQDWHLNDCKAACSHMPPDAHARWEAKEAVVCPETGYSYGSAWLVKPLTGEVLIALAGLFGPEFVQDVTPDA